MEPRGVHVGLCFQGLAGPFCGELLSNDSPSSPTSARTACQLSSQHLHPNLLSFRPHAQLTKLDIHTPIMALVNGDVPRWVADLQSPPAAKSKVPGISDPPGYPSQTSSSSKVSSLRPRSNIHRKLTCVCRSKRTRRLFSRASNRHPKRWIL